MKSIAVSAAAGATGVGLIGVVSKAATTTKIISRSAQAVAITKTAVEGVTGASLSVAEQFLKTGNVDGAQVVIDGTASATIGKAAGNNPRQSRADKLKEANNKKNNYGNKSETVVSTLVSDAPGNAKESYNEIKKERENKRRRL